MSAKAGLKDRWPWLVLAGAVVLAVFMVVRAMTTDRGLRFDDSEMPTAAQFDKTPPTDAGMNLDALDISFKDAKKKEK